MKQQMITFLKNNKGKFFTASKLAAELGWWRKNGEKKWPKARAAAKYAKKCGARVVHHKSHNECGYEIEVR